VPTRAGTRSAGRAAAGGGGGYALGGVGKSAGQQFLEEISKAVTDEERDVPGGQGVRRGRGGLQAQRAPRGRSRPAHRRPRARAVHRVAKSYELGVDDEQLGGLLFRASQALPEEDLVLLDRLLAGAGEISKALFVEQGMATVGGDSDILEEVYGIAGSAVAKNDFGMTPEQAVTAVFDNNPAAYEAYEAEQALER
jgi:hypothetical protein